MISNLYCRDRQTNEGTGVDIWKTNAVCFVGSVQIQIEI